MAYSKVKIVSLTPTITAGAYSATDVVGGRLAFSAGLDRGVIRKVILVDISGQNAALLLHLFEPTPASIADNAPFAPATADSKLLLGTVAISTYNAAAKAAYIDNVNVYFDNSAASVYGYLVTNASTPTYTAVDNLTIKLVIEAL